MSLPLFCARRRVLGVGLAAALCASPAGCGAHTPPPRTSASERLAPATKAIDDDGFASAVRALLLSDPGSADRATRLVAVQDRQMARAASRFQTHSNERGLAALTGALYLAHAGDLSRGLRSPSAVESLNAAVRELALHGDEGRSQALYNVLAAVAPEPERPLVLSHLRAIDDWIHDALGGAGPVAGAAARARVAIRRRLLEPTVEALSESDRATAQWITDGVALRDEFQRTRVAPPREEGAEAWRAIDAGPAVLASLYLRDADFAGALAALDRAHARDLMATEHPRLASALEAAAEERSVAHCGELLGQLRGLASRDPMRSEDDLDEDRDLFAAAAFSVACECYRLDPTVPMVALAVAVAVGELGMAEATGAVLSDAVHDHPEAALGSEALGLTLGAMAGEEEAGDPDAARRTFQAAQPLLLALGGKSLAGKVHPSAARLRAAMGEIELREGHIDRARALLTTSANEERTGSVLLALSRIEWRDGHTTVALDDLRAALGADDTAHDPALRGELLLALSDVTRESGDAAGARTPLTEALKELVSSRNVKGAEARARVERVLARVLDRFGAQQPAARALERAYAAAPGDKRQVAQTIELLIGRAFVRGDLAVARDGLQRALGADLDVDDLVYFALWVRLLERQMRAPTDGAADRVFASAPDDGRWVGTLARFGEGKLGGDDLVGRAKTPIQRYEALFYDGVDRRAAGDAKKADELLRQVVAGTGVELTEVSLARDLLSGDKTLVGGLPTDVQVP